MKINIDLSKLSITELVVMKNEIEYHLKLKKYENSNSIFDCDISVRAFNVLKKNNILYLEDLAKYTFDEFCKLKNVGNYTVKECTELLHSNNLDWNK